MRAGAARGARASSALARCARALTSVASARLAPRRRPDASNGGRSAEDEGGTDVAENIKSSWSFLSTVLPSSLTPKYITSQWSVAQFHTPGNSAAHSSMRTICAFGSERNTLIVISSDGSFYKCSFEPARGGECRRETFARFLQIDDEDTFRSAE